MTILEIGIDCVGCGSCQVICKSNAISMHQDDEGFLYPQVDVTKCLDCGACYLHCPQSQLKEKLGNERIPQQAYNVISRLHKLSRRSASGGVFATIAHAFFNTYDNAVVCGATYENNNVHHIVIDSVKDIYKLQGSKYVQSQTDLVYRQIKDLLIKGNKVLFGGTPCQVAGLYALIGSKLTDNLFAIDIICHGVPSLKFLLKDLTLYDKDISNIKLVQFRKKHIFYKSNSRFCLQLSKSSKNSLLNTLSSKAVSISYDPYYSLFSKGWTLRKSCYQCKYANLERVGDITIGDCDSHVYYSNFHPNEATSTVIINTKVGAELWQEYKNLFDFIPLDLQKEAEVNKQLMKQFDYPKERENIYKELNLLSIEEIRMKYAKQKSIRYLIGKILYDIFPPRLIKKIFF